MTTLRPLSYSPAAASPPAEFEAEGTDGLLVRVGPTLHGWVYRSATGTALYRVYPIDALPVPWRQEVREREHTACVRHATDGVLFPAGVSQHADAFFLIRYEPGEPVFPLTGLLDGSPRPTGVLADRLFRATVRWWEEHAGMDRNFAGLAASLASDSPSLRVMAVGWVFQAAAEWRRHAVPLLPMPADIVFDHAGRPFYMWVPFLRLPDAEDLLAEPERILYLPPELMGARGATAWATDSWYRADWYAFGVMLLQCFYRIAAPVAAESALARAANGTLFDASRRHGMAPAWLARAPASADALGWAARLTATNPGARPPADPVRLGDVIEAFGLRLTPSATVEELESADRAFDGLDLLRTLLLAGESYDNLVLAGRLAGRVGRALEGLDLFGRAIALDPPRADARLERMRLLSAASEQPELVDMANREGPRLDVLIWDDFNALDADGQRDQQLPLARFLVWRGLYEHAAPHVYRWLFDDSGEYRWLFLGMNVVYAEILLALARGAVDANQPDGPSRVWGLRAHLNTCRDAIREVRVRGDLEPGEIYRCGVSLEGIGLACLELERRVPRQPDPPAAVAETPPNNTSEERASS